MNAALLLTALSAADVTEMSVPLSADTARVRYATLAAATDGPRPSADRFAAPLCRLWERLPAVRGLPPAERRRMGRGIERRLVDMRDDLIRRGLEWERAERKLLLRGRTVRRTLAGPAERRRAAELIALIQRTIAPESWDVLGGNGTIRYFDLYHALVVRAPYHVHGEVGGALDGLRP